MRDDPIKERRSSSRPLRVPAGGVAKAKGRSWRSDGAKRKGGQSAETEPNDKPRVSTKPRFSTKKSASHKPAGAQEKPWKEASREEKRGEDRAEHRHGRRSAEAYKRDDHKKRPETRSRNGFGASAKFVPAHGDQGGKRRSAHKAEAEARAVEAGDGSQQIVQRIAKAIARSGACSRRDAELWIEQGRVALNGVVLTSPAVNVSAKDKITIDGEPLAQRVRTRLFLFHKPRGLVTTDRDPEGRRTVFDYLRQHWPEGPRVVSIGRLDINTEGLLLLTNDGGLARILELPATGWLRRYRVRANGETDQSVLDRLREGVSVDGVDYAGIEATLDRHRGANSWLTVTLREGKNREIKRVFEHIGLQVNRLIRLSFGPFQLGDLAEGEVRETPTRVLRDQLGPTLAQAAGVDFESPSGREEEETPPNVELPRQARRRDESSKRTEGKGRGAPSGRASASPNALHRDDRMGKGAAGARRGPPEAEKPKALGRPKLGPRKHVSVLRAEENRGSTGPRKRTEIGETADRSGRKVRVERIMAGGAPGGSEGERPLSLRNKRRFEAEGQSRRGKSSGGARPAFEARRPERREEGAAPSRPRTGAPGRKSFHDTASSPAANAPRRRESNHHGKGGHGGEAAGPKRGSGPRKGRPPKRS